MKRKTAICLLILPLILLSACSKKETIDALSRKWHETARTERAFVHDSLVGSSPTLRLTRWNLKSDGTGKHEVWHGRFIDMRWSTNANVDSLFVTEFIESDNPSFKGAIDWVSDHEIVITYQYNRTIDYYYERELTLKGGW